MIYLNESVIMDKEKIIENLEDIIYWDELTDPLKAKKIRDAVLLINNLSKENNKLKEKLTEVELKRPIELTGQGAESFCLAIQLSEMKQKLDKVTLEKDKAISQLHGKCSVCVHYSGHHQRGKCKNCMWDSNAAPCLIEYQEDNWEWCEKGK